MAGALRHHAEENQRLGLDGIRIQHDGIRPGDAALISDVIRYCRGRSKTVATSAGEIISAFGPALPPVRLRSFQTKWRTEYGWLAIPERASLRAEPFQPAPHKLPDEPNFPGDGVLPPSFPAGVRSPLRKKN